MSTPSRRAERLGYAGLLPFLGGTALVWLVEGDQLAFAAAALAAYAGLVCSFLGGIHWGVGLREPTMAHLGWGVVPSLVAWPAVLMPAHAGLVVLGVLIVVCYAVDRRLYPAAGLGPWLTLRFRLSAVAASCCFLGAAAT